MTVFLDFDPRFLIGIGNLQKKSNARLTGHLQILFLQPRLVFFPALQQGFGPVQAQQNHWKNRIFAGFYFTDWIKYKEKTFCRLLDSKLGYPHLLLFFSFKFYHTYWYPPQLSSMKCNFSTRLGSKLWPFKHFFYKNTISKNQKIDGYKDANMGTILNPVLSL